MYNIIGCIGRRVIVNVGVSVIMYGLAKGTCYATEKIKCIREEKNSKPVNNEETLNVDVNDLDIGNVILFKEKLKYAKTV